MSIGIVELVTVCESHERQNRHLFEQLGAWLTGDDPPAGACGRLLTEACHRHAEHADLWAARCPTIPVDADGNQIATSVGDISSYRRAVEVLRGEATALGSHVDRDLDPSTRRVVEIVDRDLASISRRLGELV